VVLVNIDGVASVGVSLDDPTADTMALEMSGLVLGACSLKNLQVYGLLQVGLCITVG